MVLQKRLDYGSSGYQVPAMPHVPRSAKGKRSVRKKIEENQMCAFDLLAAVAGQLLSERKSSLRPHNVTDSNKSPSKDTINEDQLNEEKVLKVEALDQHSSNYSLSDSKFLLQRENSYELKEQPHSLRATSSDDSVFVKSDLSVKDVIARESIVVGNQCNLGSHIGHLAERCSTQGHFNSSRHTQEYKGEGLKTPDQFEHKPPRNSIYEDTQNMHIPEDPMDVDGKTHSWVSSDSSAEVSLYRSRNNAFPKHEDGFELDVDKEDDGDSSGCTHPNILLNKTSKLQRIGDCRIRKILGSKYWKVAPTKSQDNEHSDCEVKPSFCGKKMCYTRQRTQRSTFKRKKFLERFPVSTSGGLHCDKASNLCEKAGIELEANDSHSPLSRAVGSSSSTSGQKSCYETAEYHVKLCIKSFKVPELFIEISENATVGSLKKTIMETVTALLGGGLHVGVLLQGKKIRDDNKTLRQAGISHKDKLDNLGFTLEPNATQVPAPSTFSHDPVLLSPGEPSGPLARIPPSVLDPPAIDSSGSDAKPPLLLVSYHESDHDSIHSPAVETLQLVKAPPANSRALAAVSNANALAVVPPRKSRRSEVVQRRIRRPFTVAEVEALVQTVEKLGTGRWRDVKLRAFDNAKHRTYVDLKDKWKTLVHTARISPQQRRGEPVPQELLDRVLLAHAYWSQQQAKLQVKPPPLPASTTSVPEPCLLL